MDQTSGKQRQTRVSIQESSKSGKPGEQLDGSMKYRQAENQGDCPQTETVSREKGRRQRQTAGGKGAGVQYS